MSASVATCSSLSTVRGYAAVGAPLTTPARAAVRVRSRAVFRETEWPRDGARRARESQAHVPHHEATSVSSPTLSSAGPPFVLATSLTSATLTTRGTTSRWPHSRKRPTNAGRLPRSKPPTRDWWSTDRAATSARLRAFLVSIAAPCRKSSNQARADHGVGGRHRRLHLTCGLEPCCRGRHNRIARRGRALPEWPS